MAHAFLLSLAAGLATGLGGLAGAVLRRPGPRARAFSLAFAAGVMLAVCLEDLAPHAASAWAGAGAAAWAAWGRCGCLLALGMAAGGAMARCLPEPAPAAGIDGEALRSALAVAAALALHNLPEGMLTLLSAYENRSLGAAMALAVGLHNIPEGLAVAVPVAAATGSRVRAVGWALASGLAEPLGALLAFTVLRGVLTPLFLAGSLAFIAGVMAWVCAGTLLPDAFAAARPSAAGGLCAGVVLMTLAVGLV